MLTTIKHGFESDTVRIAKLLVGFPNDDSKSYSAEFVSFVCSYQSSAKLTPDGIIGPKTWRYIAEHASMVSTSKNNPPAIKALQILLGGLDVDGLFGKKTKAAVIAYQTASKLTADGICGPKTWLALICGEVETSTSTATTTNAKPKDMKQYDSKWKSIVYTSTGNKSQTIGNSGCGTTCAANVVATWWDSKITPKETCEWAVKNGYRTANSGTSAGFFKWIANKYGASKYSAVSSFASAEACIKAGGLVIVNVGPSVWTKGGHYILLWKVEGSTVYINDPASSASNRAKNSVNNLKAAAKGYYCLWK